MASKPLYESTRGGEKGLSFRHVVLKGLADDGGLFVPSHLPRVDSQQLARWRTLPYMGLAFEILSLFIDEEDIPAAKLREIIERSYSSFFLEEVLHVQPCYMGNKEGGEEAKGHTRELVNVCELFHGPTFSFKDFALQFLGHVFEHLLNTNALRKQQQQGAPVSEQEDAASVTHITVLGATSGDTGSAALAGLRGKKNVEVFVLHPHGRVSHIQEKQMTTITDPNVHNISVEGTFDDCQKLVKDTFNDLSFKRKHNLAAINSINWARILAQTVYYFYTYFQVTSPAQQKAGAKVVFSVPTGNFGNVLAGFYAQQMGLPVHRFIVATNQNDILHRFFASGKYETKAVMPSFSPSMDIQVSSNFERFFYEVSNRDAAKVAEWMTKFNQTGVLDVPQDIHAKACSLMTSYAVSEDHTLATIKRYKEDSDYILCPHSAIGVYALEQKWRELSGDASHPICYASLATASPAKFADAQKKALGYVCPLPKELERIMGLPSRCQKVDGDVSALKSLMEEALKDAAARKGQRGGERLLGRRIRARVPGSCANLGSGFDVFGIAVGLYLTTHVQVSKRKEGEPELSIEFEGEGKGGVPLDATNFLWTSMLHVARKEGAVIPPNARFALSIQNDIPLGRGLGSSGAAVVSGVLLADGLFDLGLSTSQVLSYCVEIEGHPDNASASLRGGFVACCGFESDPKSPTGVPNVYARRLPYSDKLKAVVAIPNFEVSTEKARQALPPTYPRAEVVFNLQRVGLMATALTDDGIDEPSVISEAMKDKIHQPFRMHLVPGLQECLALSPQAVPGLLGVCLSGSGSTILALCRDNFAGVEQRMREALQQAGVQCRTATLDIDRRGSLVSTTTDL